jgi:hypothetical protein
MVTPPKEVPILMERLITTVIAPLIAMIAPEQIQELQVAALLHAMPLAPLKLALIPQTIPHSLSNNFPLKHGTPRPIAKVERDMLKSRNFPLPRQMTKEIKALNLFPMAILTQLYLKLWPLKLGCACPL